MTQADEYFCPDEKHPISRAVHLGRLANFYPACRSCPHRDDTGTLSLRQVRQLAETRPRGQSQSLFHDGWVGGVYLNDLTPAVAREIAAAFGTMLRQGKDWRTEKQEDRTTPPAHPSSLIPHPSSSLETPFPDFSVVLAGDGRAITAELVAAVSEGLRFSGCSVIDIGPATAACLAFAIDHLTAAGGILVGNPAAEPHIVGLKFWTGLQPLSTPASLEPLAELHRSGAARRADSFGALHRFQAETPYLAALADRYHGLRPLRVLLDSASAPLVRYMEQLTAPTACRVVACRTTREQLPGQIRAAAAHFAARIDGNGEGCEVFDERGLAMPPERLSLLLASLGGRDCSTNVGDADALTIVTLLLQSLSRSDAPFSAVLDRDASVG